MCHSRLGKVYNRALVVPPSSPHQRVLVCGACTGTAQVGVPLVSLFNPLFKRSRLHCFDICLTWYLWHLKIWWQHLLPTYRVTTWRVCSVKHMMMMRYSFPRLWYDPYPLHARGLGLCLFLVRWSVICCQDGGLMAFAKGALLEEYLSHNFDEQCLGGH